MQSSADTQQQNESGSIIIGIAGGSGSGKTTLCRMLADSVNAQSVILSSDDYYHPNDHLSTDERANLNFDHPNALDLPLLATHLHQLRQSQTISAPQYCFATHTRLTAVRPVAPKPIVFVEGVLIFASSELRDAMHLRIFMDADDAVRFERRLQRDTRERSRTAQSVKSQWDQTVAPMHRQYVHPSRSHAHLIVNSNELNPLSHELLRQGIQQLIQP